MNKVTIICALCKKEFARDYSDLKNSKSGLYFCCRKHKDEAQRLSNNFVEIRPKHYKDGRYIYRDIAFRNYPPKCEICGYDRYKVALDVHHIDGNRTNNVLENLIILCPICHITLTRKIGVMVDRQIIIQGD